MGISKYENLFSKGYVPNCSGEDFVIKKVKITVSQTYLIADPNGEVSIGTFYKKELLKTIQKELRIEKIIKREGNKLFVKWKAYGKSVSSLVDKKGYNDMKNELFSRTAC